MKKSILILIISSFILSHYTVSQKFVLNADEVESLVKHPFMPDVDGKVLVHESIFTNHPYTDLLNGIVLYENWPINLTGSSQRGGVYCNLDEDEDLEIVYCVTQNIYAWNIDGTVVDGWPVTVSQYPDGAPAFGDIDGDGEGEIVVSSRQAGTGNTGTLTAFHKDGSIVNGFPVTLTGGATKTPVLADLNGDGVNEIIVEERAWPDGYLGVYSGDGSPYPGFPVALDYIPGSAVAVGDITGDNIPEIVAESYYSIYAFDVSGNVLEGFPFTPGNERVFSYSTPVLADLDGDGNREIIAGDHSTSAGNGAIHILKSDGTAFDGWPQYVGNWIYGPAAVGDIDGDGSLDIAVGDQVLSATPNDRVYAWDKDGNNLPGWPTDFINSINNQIILADLDGDNMVELMWDDNTSGSIYLGYNHDGSVMEGWPLSTNYSTFFMNPFVVDINNDGILDISGAGGDIINSNLEFYLWNANVSVNPDHSPLTILQYNVRHDGTYVDESVLAAGFNASAVEVCEGTEVDFSDQSTGNVTSWEWTFEGGDPATSTEQNPSVTYSTTGIFDVELNVSDGTNSSTAFIEDYMVVGYAPVIPDQPSGPSNFSTDTVNLTYYETWAPNADEYIWELIPEDAGVIVAGDTITQIKIYWSSDPDYSAELKVKSVNVCGESDFCEALTIYVNWSLGIASEIQKNSIEVFPNPSNGNFTIHLNDDDDIQSVAIANAQGRIVREPIGVENEKNLSLEGLSSGMYYIYIRTSKAKYCEKIIVR